MKTSELNEIINECRRFAKKEIRDHVLEADLAPSSALVETIWSKSAQLDIPALLLPEVYGGAGFSPLCAALILDTLAADCSGIASVFAHHFAACLPLAQTGTDISEHFCTRIVRMEKWGARPGAVVFPPAWGAPEPELTASGSTLQLNGETEPVANTEFAGFFCLFVSDPIAANGITCLFLKQERMEPALGEETCLPGLKLNPFRSLRFDHFPISADDILGERGQAAAILETTRNAFCGFIAAMAMGAARTACRKALDYAGERYQHGNTIIHHQEIQRMLGAILMKVNTGTAAVLKLFDEAGLNLPFSRPDPMLIKSFCTSAALEIVIDAIQIHGGYGYMHEYVLEKIMRDSKVLQLIGGSPPLHHVQAIARRA